MPRGPSWGHRSPSNHHAHRDRTEASTLNRSIFSARKVYPPLSRGERAGVRVNESKYPSPCLSPTRGEGTKNKGQVYNLTHFRFAFLGALGVLVVNSLFSLAFSAEVIMDGQMLPAVRQSVINYMWIGNFADAT